MMRVLASAVLGLTLLSACASEEPAPTRPPGTFRPQPTTPTPMTPAGSAGTSSSSGPPTGFGTNPDGLMPIAGTGSFGTAGDGSIKTENCGSTDIVTGRVQPTVWLVIDGSGSMAEGIVAGALPGAPAEPGQSRWDALRPALMDPNGGVVPTLQNLVKFGMVLYDGPLPGGVGMPMVRPDGTPTTGTPPTDGACPRLLTVEPALNAFAALDPMIPMLPPGGSTPTHKALAQVLSHLPATTMLPDGSVDPTYVVLATDGAPNDYCGGGGGGGLFGGGGTQPQSEVVSLTQRMAMQGVPVYVISLASADAGLSAHLANVAQAGGTMKPPFTPQNKQQLVDTFMEIIGPEVGCTVKLQGGWGVMPDNACMGTVTLNGQELPCNDDNGWKLIDPKTIEVTGTMCELYKKETNARLTANFPCAVQQPG